MTTNTLELAAPLRCGSRWPIMALLQNRIRIPRETSTLTRSPMKSAAANGPMIEEWEKVFRGMTLVCEDAPFTAGAGEGRGRLLSRNSVRGNLVFVVRHASEGSALSRLPIEVLDRIGQIVHYSVCATGFA
jgi:hypothetical protein